MKRLQLFEFEDFDWLPGWIRSSMTNLLVVFHKILGTKEVLGNLLKEIKDNLNYKQIVDLGSGSGGIMPEAVAYMNDESREKVNLLLTDLYPDKEKVDFINDLKLANVKYSKESLNATDLGNAPQGLKVMANSFHHMRPENAKAILNTAQGNNEPLLIYEISENKIPLLGWWIFLPIGFTLVFLMALIQTPFSKPLTIQQLVFTYIIPVIPLLYAWDGQASMPRMYTFDDVKEMLPEASDNYEWTMEQAKKPNGKKLGYYILGVPK